MYVLEYLELDLKGEIPNDSWKDEALVQLQLPEDSFVLHDLAIQRRWHQHRFQVAMNIARTKYGDIRNAWIYKVKTCQENRPKAMCALILLLEHMIGLNAIKYCGWEYKEFKGISFNE